MNSQIKKRWIDALRSGNYSQDANVLRSTKGHCCLGVLCDLYAKEHNAQWSVHRYNSNLGEHFDIPEDEVNEIDRFDQFHFDGELELLPDNVKIWAGLNHRSPYVYHNGKQLSELNDVGASFNEIADLIEEYDIV